LCTNFLLCVLLYRGADIYAKDTGDFTPMMNAITHQHKEVVKVFFDFDYTADSLAKHDKMLLEWAIEQDHIVLIEVLSLLHKCAYFTNKMLYMVDCICDLIKLKVSLQV